MVSGYRQNLSTTSQIQKKKHIPIERINNYQKYVSAWGILKIYMPQNIMMKKHDAALV